MSFHYKDILSLSWKTIPFHFHFRNYWCEIRSSKWQLEPRVRCLEWSKQPRISSKPMTILHKIYTLKIIHSSVQFSSVTPSCPTLCDPMDCSTPGLPVHHQLPEFTQTHVHWVGDAIQPSHSLLSPSPPAFNLSQHQGLFKRVSPSHEVAKLLEFQLQHQSFQWTPRTDLL